MAGAGRAPGLLSPLDVVSPEPPRPPFLVLAQAGTQVTGPVLGGWTQVESEGRWWSRLPLGVRGLEVLNLCCQFRQVG